MFNQEKRLSNDSMRVFSNSDTEAPEALEHWEIEDFEDILPRGIEK